MDKKYSCDKCDLEYKTLCGLKKHVKVKHQKPSLNDKQYKCAFCDSSFGYRQSKWLHEQKCKTINEVPLAEQVKNLSAEVKELKAKPLTNIINNTTNNIQYVIKPYGTESIEHLTTEKQREIMQKGLNSLTYLIKVNNFNKDIPENHSYCVTALNDKHASVINPDTNTIVKADKNELFDKIMVANLSNLDTMSNNKNFTEKERQNYKEKIEKLKEMLMLNKKGLKVYYKEINLLGFNNKNLVLETWASLKSLDNLLEPENIQNQIEYKIESTTKSNVVCKAMAIALGNIISDKYANDSGSELSDSDTESVEDAEIKIKNITYIIEGNKLYQKLESGKGAFYGTYSNGKVKKANKNIEL